MRGAVLVEKALCSCCSQPCFSCWSLLLLVISSQQRHAKLFIVPQTKTIFGQVTIR